MSRHRAEPTPLIAKVDGIRVMWRPGPDDTDGSLTAPDSMIAKLGAAFEAKTLVPVMGVLVAADAKTMPGVLAAMHAVSTHSVVVDSMPGEVTDWFAAHRATAAAGARPEGAPDPAQGVVPLTADGGHSGQRSALAGVSSLLKKRVSFGKG